MEAELICCVLELVNTNLTFVSLLVVSTGGSKTAQPPFLLVRERQVYAASRFLFSTAGGISSAKHRTPYVPHFLSPAQITYTSSPPHSRQTPDTPPSKSTSDGTCPNSPKCFPQSNFQISFQ